MKAKEQVPAPWDRPSGAFGCPQRLSGSKRVVTAAKTADDCGYNSGIRGMSVKKFRS